MLQHIKLLSLFSFFVNKNLFLERYNFLKNLKKSTQDLIYWTYFVFSKYIIWGILFGAWYFFKWPTAILSALLILHLLIRLVMLDIDDWQLYFKDDIKLAIPEQSKRYLTILLNNLVYKFFVADNIFIYIIALKFLSPISIKSLFFISIGYLAISGFVLSLYLVLRVGTLKLKVVYSIFSYLSAMITMFVVGHIIIKGIAYIVSLMYSLVRGNFEFKLDEWFNGILLHWNGFLSNERWFILISLALIFISILGGLFVYYSKNLEMQNEEPTLHISNFIKKLTSFRKKNDLLEVLVSKENKLITDIYKYNFKQYYFTFFMDRPYVILLALIINFYTFDLSCKNLLFLGLSSLLFMTEIESIMGNKLIANLSFITEFNTLRLLNTNGISIQNLTNSKMCLFYNVRLIPTLIFAATVVAGHIILGSSLIFTSINVVSLLIILIFYPKDYFTRNLICTRMDYKDYENYLTEKNILEGGVDDFSPLNWLYKTMFFILIITSICVSIFPNIATCCNVVCIGIFIFAPIVCHVFMKKIYQNIISFIERGDYSADFSKIFKNV